MNKLRKRRLKKRLSNNKVKIIIATILVCILSLGSGYALLNQKLDIKGKATIAAASECKYDVIGTFTQTGSWQDGSGKTVYAVTIDITNNSVEDINGWTIKVKGPSDMTVTSNADISETVNGVTSFSATMESQNYSWNSIVYAGQTKSIYVSFNTVEANFDPEWVTFNDCKIYGSGVVPVDPDKPDPAIELKGLTLTPAHISMTIGEKLTLIATKNPTNADGDLTWVSSDPSIVTVDNNGTVTTIKSGNATITVSSGEISATSEVTVENAIAPSTNEVKVVFEKTTYWGSEIIQYKITITNESDKPITKCSFHLNMPNGTEYTFWSNLTNDGNNLTSNNTINAGEFMEFYGQLSIPAGYNSADYLTTSVTSIQYE